MSDDDIRVRCLATTKAGAQCKNYAREGSSYCYTHRTSEVSNEPIKTQLETAVADESEINVARMRRLVDELDTVVQQLKESFPDGQATLVYSPIRLATLLRDNLSKLPPDIQLGLLENFEGMTREDLMDIETWKGVAYMMSYSARFQADQVRNSVDSRLPEPLQSSSFLRLFKSGYDRHR